MKEPTMSVYARLMAAGQVIESHQSDLYTPVNEVTERILADHEHSKGVTRFQSAVDGKMWFDVPFGYMPFWEMVEGSKHVR